VATALVAPWLWTQSHLLFLTVVCLGMVLWGQGHSPMMTTTVLFDSMSSASALTMFGGKKLKGAKQRHCFGCSMAMDSLFLTSFIQIHLGRGLWGQGRSSMIMTLHFFEGTTGCHFAGHVERSQMWSLFWFLHGHGITLALFA
jgi:hypothetical protein